MTAHDFKKGDLVRASSRVKGLSTQYIIRRVHRDGTLTVEARHHYEGDRVSGSYLGFHHRAPASLFWREAHGSPK